MPTICQSIASIIGNYLPDAEGIIEVAGLTESGDVIHMIIHTFDDGQDYIWPGFNFLPYGGIYYNRLILGIADSTDKVSVDKLKDLACSIKLGDDYGDDDWIVGCDSIADHCEAYPYN